jgi:hypothetical protein
MSNIRCVEKDIGLANPEKGNLMSAKRTGDEPDFILLTIQAA